MARRMLIDASHPEETRVVVVDGTKLTEFDFETGSRKPLKGNIYLAKVIRIEPSLQAAFVEYGGNRHGFLAFSEIHPDYFQIPVADREKLIAEQQRLADEEPEHRSERFDRTDIEDAREEAADAAEDAEATNGRPENERPEEASPVAGSLEEPAAIQPPAAHEEPASAEASRHEASPHEAAPEPATEPGSETEAAPAPAPAPAEAAGAEIASAAPAAEATSEATAVEPISEAAAEKPVDETGALAPTGAATVADAAGEAIAAPETASERPAEAEGEVVAQAAEIAVDSISAPAPVEVVGGDDAGEEPQSRERRRRQPIRQYKIQEVIKRRQILLVQVVKEERGNKGAALTTFLSLAGRYCVLMPNAGRGGGISRKISNPADRKRMKEMLAELDVPQGMGVILRTAGLERSNIDIKRDYEYLSRLWDSIRELTMRSTAPALIYEEGDLIKRSLRDIYDTDIAQVLVEGEAGFQAASGFMRQLIPHQAEKVQLYNEQIPLFHRYQVESQFDAMHLPTVQLRSGGYIVINPTEALVAIDVNSGRSTKERNIEETALRTNLEAAEEVARQVRLRDLAGLIVVDFIDMEENRHQRQVEHKMKDAMRNDRARIQIGRISAFGLLEMSRQRLRPSLLEHSTEICPHCAGVGRVRSIESAALHALRAIEEEGVRRRSSEIVVSVPPNVALYLLNQKRHGLSEIEQRYAFHVTIEADDELHAADCEIERVRPRRDDQRPAQELARASYDAVAGEEPLAADDSEIDDAAEPGAEVERLAGDEEGADGRNRKRRRRRRRSGRRDDDRPQGEGEDRPQAAVGNGHDVTPSGDEPSMDSDRDPVGDEEGDGQSSGEARADGESPGDRPRVEGREDTADGDGGDANRRRRGRRGGRRRRRENGDGSEPIGEHAHQYGQEPNGGWEPRADEPVSADASPSAPFEDQPVASLDGQPAVPFDGQPVEQMAGGQMPVEAAPAEWRPAMIAEAAPVVPPPAVIAPPPEPVVAQAPQPIPLQAEVEAEQTPPPPVVPVISADLPPEKPKRGWWRR
ncbi:Rne/Rng family ribonuclease [Reyranella sp.]|uniref:ribonuclease E/G n=1 Tax=Reyranella sp. TaxID=1929291 RepID=UPI003D09DF0C